MSSRDVEKFAENLIDDLRAAEDIRKRDRADTGARMTLEELITSQGFDPTEFGVSGEPDE